MRSPRARCTTLRLTTVCVAFTVGFLASLTLLAMLTPVALKGRAPAPRAVSLPTPGAPRGLPDTSAPSEAFTVSTVHAAHARRPAADPGTSRTPRTSGVPAAWRSPGPWRLVGAGRDDRLVRGGQGAIDRCHATIFYGRLPISPGSGTLWLAGHDYCGFAAWARLRRGDQMRLESPAGVRFGYRVAGRRWLDHQGGSSAGLVHGDLLLQTCKGAGTSLTYLERTAAPSSSRPVAALVRHPR